MIVPDRGRGVDTRGTPGRPPDGLTIALAYAKHGWWVFPLCFPTPDGLCGCGGKRDDAGLVVPHGQKEVGKAPIGRHTPQGVKDATTNSATIDRWWRATPNANVGINLERSRLVLVDPDSAEAEIDAISRGLDGSAVRESRNRAYIFKRPDNCPAINLIKLDGDPLDIMATGYVVAHGTHQTGSPVRFDPAAELGPAPAWAVDLLRHKAAEKTAQQAATAARRAERSAHGGEGSEPPVRLHQRGMRRWTGELVATKKDEKLDRDLSLFYLALDLADCNASEGAIVAALEDRDEALGWRKFTGRSDAEKRYVEIAEKAVASAIKKQNAPSITFTAPATDDVAALHAAIEERDAEIMRLQRRALDQDDRLEIIEPIVAMIDEILARPDDELSSDDKVVDIGLARYLPHYRAKREANGEQPTVALGYLSKVIGMPKRRISKSLDRQSSNDPNAGAPFRKIVTRRVKLDANNVPVINPKTGKTTVESSMEVIPWGDSPAATLRAAAAYVSPARPKRGGSKEASDARWGRCDKHDNREVRVKGFCPDCGKVVGERIVRLAEFDVLNVQVGHSEKPAPSVPSSSTVSKVKPIERHLGHSERPPEAQELLNIQPVHSEAPIQLRPHQEVSGKCCGVTKPNGRECISTMYRDLSGGRLRCLGCGSETAVAMCGASE